MDGWIDGKTTLVVREGGMDGWMDGGMDGKTTLVVREGWLDGWMVAAKPNVVSHI